MQFALLPGPSPCDECPKRMTKTQGREYVICGTEYIGKVQVYCAGQEQSSKQEPEQWRMIVNRFGNPHDLVPLRVLTACRFDGLVFAEIGLYVFALPVIPAHGEYV